MPLEVGFKMDGRIDPWQMQPGESSESYSYFVIYRDMGPGRTNKKAAEQFLATTNKDFQVAAAEDRARMIDLAHHRFEVHSAQHNWKARVRAYDAMMDRELVQARLRGQREAMYEAGQQHGQLLKATLAVAGRYLKKFHDQKNPNFGNERIDTMEFNTILSILKTGIPLERLALGMDTAAENGAINEQMDGRTARISPEEAKRIAREAAAEVKMAEPDPDSIVLEPPKE